MAIKLTKFLVNEYTKQLNDLHDQFLIANNELEVAKEKGDLSENAEYTLALNKLTSLDKEISDINSILKNCEIVERTMDKNHVDYGSLLVLRFTNVDDTPINEKVFKQYPTIWNMIPNYGKFTLPSEVIFTPTSITDRIDEIYREAGIENCKFSKDSRSFEERYKGIPVHLLSQDTVVGTLLYGKDLSRLPVVLTYIDNSSTQRKVWVLDHNVPEEAQNSKGEEAFETNEFSSKGV